MMGPNNNGGGVKDSPLLRKLQAVKESPLGRRLPMKGLNGIAEDPMDEETRLRTKELEAQKARIVAQMAPVREEDEDYPEKGFEEKFRVRAKVADRENVPPPVPAMNAVRVREREREREKERVVAREREHAVVAPGK